MMFYGTQHLSVTTFTAKIGMDNTRSIALFRRLGFSHVSESAVFREVTLSLLMDVNAVARLQDQWDALQVRVVDAPGV